MHDDPSAELIGEANLAVARGMEWGARHAKLCSLRQQGWGRSRMGNQVGCCLGWCRGARQSSSSRDRERKCVNAWLAIGRPRGPPADCGDHDVGERLAGRGRRHPRAGMTLGSSVHVSAGSASNSVERSSARSGKCCRRDGARPLRARNGVRCPRGSMHPCSAHSSGEGLAPRASDAEYPETDARHGQLIAIRFAGRARYHRDRLDLSASAKPQLSLRDRRSTTSA